MSDNYTKSGKETAERSPGNHIHTVNKKRSDTTQPNHRPATATFIVVVSVVSIEVVSKALLALGLTPPIRSVADFGGVNSLAGFIHGVKTEVRS